MMVSNILPNESRCNKCSFLPQIPSNISSITRIECLYYNQRILILATGEIGKCIPCLKKGM